MRLFWYTTHNFAKSKCNISYITYHCLVIIIAFFPSTLCSFVLCVILRKLYDRLPQCGCALFLFAFPMLLFESSCIQANIPTNTNAVSYLPNTALARKSYLSSLCSWIPFNNAAATFERARSLSQPTRGPSGLTFRPSSSQFSRWNFIRWTSISGDFKLRIHEKTISERSGIARWYSRFHIRQHHRHYFSQFWRTFTYKYDAPWPIGLNGQRTSIRTRFRGCKHSKNSRIKCLNIVGSVLPTEQCRKCKQKTLKKRDKVAQVIRSVLCES